MHENDEQAFANLQNMIIPHLKIRDSKSPPKAQVDEASLQQAMDRNKESLKVKLMTRRPINQLVEQGIIPSMKATPHFYVQRQKLERAKMGDFLKNKIQRRPDRQELIQQHILEDTKIDPSLQDKQRQLKKARLADDLNDRLSHRPGPLELVKGNILHVDDEKFAQAVKEGQIPFKRTCEGQAVRHPLPSFVFEEDSGSDVALSPPQDALDQSLSGMSSMDSMALSPYTNQESPSSSMGELRITTSTPPSMLPSPVSTQSGGSSQTEQVPRESTTTVRSRKKSKPKSQPKTRTIKFHEYKGPPSAQKNQIPLNEPETSYELLLQQQQLFLQWHLEWQQKYPQMILPVTHQPQADQSKSNANPSQSAEQSQDVSTSSPQPLISKFEDLKVNDLKAELKKRNLPVSGSKPQLIERLKNHLDSNSGNKMSVDKVPIETTTTVPINVSGIILDTLPTLMVKPEPVTSVVTVESPLSNATPQLTMSEDAALMVYNAVPVQGQIVASRPASTAPMDIEMNSSVDAMDCTDNANAINENIVKLQQKKIQQLQRELQRSKMQLQQQQWLQHQQQKQQQTQQQVLLATQPVPIAPALPTTHVVSTTTLTSIPHPNTVDTKALQKLQQHLQQKFQQQQLLQQLQQPGNGGKFAPGSPAMSAAVKANLAAFIHNQQANSVRIPATTFTHVNQQSAAPYANFKNILLCPQPLQAIVEKPRANSLPNGFAQQKLVWTSSVPNFSNVLPAKPAQIENAESKFVSKKAPPDYSEATKQLIKPKQEKSQSSGKRSGRKSVKSQAVDEVLEILIRNGELPPSAAQDPPTPTTPETQKACNLAPVFPSVSNSSDSVGNHPLPNGTLSQMENPNSLDLLSVKMESEPSCSLIQEQNPPVFDNSLLLELQNIESMDLGVLDTSDCTPQTSFADLSQQQPHQQVSNSCLTNSDSVMDVELPDWLEVITNNNPMVSTAIQPRSSCYNSDPLLPTMGNSQEILDMFSLDEFDFKAPTDSSNTLNWDKVDFAA